MNAIGRYGIVTAISPHMWNSYLLFHMSLMRHNSYQLYVIGLELSDQQIEFVTRQPNTTLIIIDQKDINHFNTIGDDWRKWYKPSFIIKAIDNYNLEFVIWLDADIIITNSLDELFTHSIDKFFVVQDYFAPQYCQNKNELYANLNIPTPNDCRVLNSGVVGMSLPRDRSIIDKWEENVNTINTNNLCDHVSLYDQGALLLTLQNLDKLDYIIGNKNWNYPAQRLLYDNSKHVVDAIADDHPTATVIHYAGVPKLDHLQTVNSQQNISYFRKRYGKFTTAKTFITGSDQLLSEIVTLMRRGTKFGGWFMHVDSPSLAINVYKKFLNEPTIIDHELMNYLNRDDCPFAYTASPYFGPLFDELFIRWPNADYVVVLSEPFDTIKHKFHHYLLWPNKIDECPGFYQSDYGQATRSDQSLWYRNKFRIIVNNNSNLINMCVDEYMWMLEQALNFVQQKHGRIIWATNAITAIDNIVSKSNMFDRLLNISQSRPKHHPSTDAWINEFLEPFRQCINDAFLKLLCRYNVYINNANFSI